MNDITDIKDIKLQTNDFLVIDTKYKNYELLDISTIREISGNITNHFLKYNIYSVFYQKNKITIVFNQFKKKKIPFDGNIEIFINSVIDFIDNELINRTDKIGNKDIKYFISEKMRNGLKN